MKQIPSPRTPSFVNLRWQTQSPSLDHARPGRAVRRAHRRISRGRVSRSGLSLLEAMFAIAILGLSLAAIGRLVQLGFQAAGRARIQSQAQMLCDAQMAEVAAGALPLEAVSTAPIEEVLGWLYSIEVQPAEQIGLLVVKVTVQQDADAPLGYSIVRFMPDPNFEFNETNE